MSLTPPLPAALVATGSHKQEFLVCNKEIRYLECGSDKGIRTNKIYECTVALFNPVHGIELYPLEYICVCDCSLYIMATTERMWVVYFTKYNNRYYCTFAIPIRKILCVKRI